MMIHNATPPAMLAHWQVGMASGVPHQVASSTPSAGPAM